jgi:hypothetical protein
MMGSGQTRDAWIRVEAAIEAHEARDVVARHDGKVHCIPRRHGLVAQDDILCVCLVSGCSSYWCFAVARAWRVTVVRFT